MNGKPLVLQGHPAGAAVSAATNHCRLRQATPTAAARSSRPAAVSATAVESRAAAQALHDLCSVSKLQPSDRLSDVEHAKGHIHGHVNGHANGHKLAGHILPAVQLQDAQLTHLVLDDGPCTSRCLHGHVNGTVQHHLVDAHDLQGSSLDVVLLRSEPGSPARNSSLVWEPGEDGARSRPSATSAQGQVQPSQQQQQQQVDQVAGFLDADSRSGGETSTSAPSTPLDSPLAGTSNGIAGSLPPGRSRRKRTAPASQDVVPVTSSPEQLRDKEDSRLQCRRKRISRARGSTAQGENDTRHSLPSTGQTSRQRTPAGLARPLQRASSQQLPRHEDSRQTRSLTVAIERCLTAHELAQLLRMYLQRPGQQDDQDPQDRPLARSSSSQEQQQHQQLAQHLQPSVQLNAKHVAAALHRLAVIQQGGPATPRHLQRLQQTLMAQLLIRAREQLDSPLMGPQELTNIFWALVKQRFQAGSRTKPLYIELMVACSKQFDKFTAQGLALLLYCVAEAGMSGLRADWAAQLFGALQREAPGLTPHGIALVLHSLARLRCPPPVELFHTLCAQLQATLQGTQLGSSPSDEHARAGAASHSAHQYSQPHDLQHHQQQPQHCPQAQQPHNASANHSGGTPAGSTMPAPQQQQQQQVGTWVPSDITLAAWAIAKLNLRPPEALLLAVESWSVAWLHALDDQSLSNLVWAFARLQHVPGTQWQQALFATLHDERRLAELGAQALSNMLHAAVQLRLPLPAPLMQRVLDSAGERFEAFTHQGLALLVASAAQAGHHPGREWLDRFHACLQAGPVDSRFVPLIRDAFRSLGYTRGGRGLQQQQQQSQKLQQQRSQPQPASGPAARAGPTTAAAAAAVAPAGGASAGLGPQGDAASSGRRLGSPAAAAAAASPSLSAKQVAESSSSAEGAAAPAGLQPGRHRSSQVLNSQPQAVAVAGASGSGNSAGGNSSAAGGLGRASAWQGRREQQQAEEVAAEVLTSPLEQPDQEQQQRQHYHHHAAATVGTQPGHSSAELGSSCRSRSIDDAVSNGSADAALDDEDELQLYEDAAGFLAFTGSVRIGGNGSSGSSTCSSADYEGERTRRSGGACVQTAVLAKPSRFAL